MPKESGELKLQIITPAKKIVENTVREVIVPGADGELGILPGHVALVSALGYGVLWFEQNGKKKYFAIEGGVFRVQNDTVTILADCAEDAESLDLARAKKALERAMERRKMSKAAEVIDIERAYRAESRALARIEALARVGVR